MTEEFEREERAFSEALRASADAEGFRPLDPAQFQASDRAPRAGVGNWAKGLAAAAALVIVVGAAALILPRLGGAAGSASVAAAPEAAGGMAEPRPQSATDRADAAAENKAPGEWTPTSASPLSPRSNAAGAWLDGRFYVVGGQLDEPCPPNASCKVPSRLLRDGASYDPATDTWRPIAEAPVPIADGTPIAVAGRLYFQLGAGSDPEVYAYDPAADDWAKIPAPEGRGTLTAAGDLVASIHYSDEESGGFDEFYDPEDGRWTRLPDDPLGQSFNRSAVWVNGKLLLFGQELVASPGSEQPSVVRLAELDLGTMTWRRLPDSEVIGDGAVAVGDLVVFPRPGSSDGGEVNNWGRFYPMGGVYHATSEEWSDLPTLPPSWGEGVTRAWDAATVSGNLVLAQGHLLDPAGRGWIRLSPPPTGNLLGQTVIAGPDGLLVFGGWTGGRHTASAHYLPLR